MTTGLWGATWWFIEDHHCIFPRDFSKGLCPTSVARTSWAGQRPSEAESHILRLWRCRQHGAWGQSGAWPDYCPTAWSSRREGRGDGQAYAQQWKLPGGCLVMILPRPFLLIEHDFFSLLMPRWSLHIYSAYYSFFTFLSFGVIHVCLALLFGLYAVGDMAICSWRNTARQGRDDRLNGSKMFEELCTEFNTTLDHVWCPELANKYTYFFAGDFECYVLQISLLGNTNCLESACINNFEYVANKNIEMCKHCKAVGGVRP